MKNQKGKSDSNSQAVAAELEKLLADEYILYTKTRNPHWNVEGPDFHSMHLFFESQYQQLEVTVDDVAERIRSIGHYAPATLKEFLSLTHLTEKKSTKNDSQGFIADLLGDHQSIINFLKENIGPFADKYKDYGTSDFLTSLLEAHEKMAWMLKSHLKK